MILPKHIRIIRIEHNEASDIQLSVLVFKNVVLLEYIHLIQASSYLKVGSHFSLSQFVLGALQRRQF